jgi:hypothetical protein
MTAIVSMALGLTTGDPEAAFQDDNMGRSLVDVDDDPMAQQTSAERKVSQQYRFYLVVERTFFAKYAALCEMIDRRRIKNTVKYT